MTFTPKPGEPGLVRRHAHHGHEGTDACPPARMKYGSLFAGIGGLDLGLDRAGMTCAWQIEIDTQCQGVLATHWSEVSRYSDVRNVDSTELEPVDLICGGFPCQDLSVAGRRAGLAGERSGLWHEFHRILDGVRPRWVVVENVPGLLSSHRGRDFAVVLSGLVELGYGCAWRILDAQYFGVAQRRRRVFVVGCLGDSRAAAATVLFEPESSDRDSPPRRETGKDFAGALGGGPDGSGRYSQDDANYLVGTLQGGGKRGYRVDAETAAGGAWSSPYRSGRQRRAGRAARCDD